MLTARPVNAKLQKKQKILIVDDHELMRLGITAQLSQYPEFTICGQADNAVKALRLAKQKKPNLALVDLSLGDHNGVDLIKQLIELHAGIRVLVLSMYSEDLYAERALRAGASGYLNKCAHGDHLVEAVRAVLAGQQYLSQEMTDRLVRVAVGAGRHGDVSPIDAMSDRELEVFRLIGEGYTTGAIARKLCLSSHTIDTHREKLKVKLGLRNGAELLREAVRWTLENG